MSEQKFLMYLKKSFLSTYTPWLHYFKIPDQPKFRGMNTQFDIKKPYDAFLVYRGIHIAIEAKFQKDYSAFGMKDLRENQIKGLDDAEMAGGMSFIFLNIKRPTDHVKQQKRCNRLLIFPWSEFKAKGKSYFKEELITRHQTDFKKERYPGVDQFLRGIERYAASDEFEPNRRYSNHSIVHEYIKKS